MEIDESTGMREGGGMESCTLLLHPTGRHFVKLKAQIYKIKDKFSFPFYRVLYVDLKINQIKVDG